MAHSPNIAVISLRGKTFTQVVDRPTDERNSVQCAGKPKRGQKGNGIRVRSAGRCQESVHRYLQSTVRLRSGCWRLAGIFALHQDFTEFVRGVTPRAVFPETPAMDIVAAVAVGTLRTLPCRIARAGMAGRTDQTAMLAS